MIMAVENELGIQLILNINWGNLSGLNITLKCNITITLGVIGQ